MICQRVLLSFLLVFLLFSPLTVPISPAADLTAQPLGTLDHSGANVPLNVLRGSPEYTTIALESPDIVIEERNDSFTAKKVFGIPGESFIIEEGVPMVPQVPRFYRIPFTGGVELVLSNTDYELMEDVDVMPYQIEGSDHFGLARSPVYDQDQWYPPVVAEMSEPMIMRDFRIVRVVLYPVQVNPVTRQARVYHNLSCEIVANDQPGINEIANPHPPTRSWVPIYRDIIENLDEGALDDAPETPGPYMIITKTAPQAMEWADSLRIWKKRKGYEVVVDARASWTAAQIISAVQTAFANWPTPPEFVALIGDPAWTHGVPTDGGNYDHSYAKGNNSDDLEDIGVGRLSGSSTNEMATINAKIMGYERTPHMENSQGEPDTMWFHRGFYYAGIGSQSASNWLTIQWAAQQFRDWTGVDSTYLGNHLNQIDATLCCNRLAQGLSFFIWRGAYAGEWSTSVPGTCAASWRLPIVQLCTCYTNDFTDGVGQAEAFILAGSATAPKGGVAAIGTSTGGTNLPENLTIVGGLSYNMANLHVEHYGHCLNGAKMWLTRLWGPGSGQANSFSRWNNLMGDPGISMWTDVPNVMEVDHPTTINVGTRQMEIDIRNADNDLAIEDALVVLWKGDETYERGLTDAQGHIQLPLDIETAGDLLLTVTKRNHKPYLYTISCVAAAQMVTLSSYSVDDDNSGGTIGNADGNINPGETIDLPIYLRNFGNSTTGTNVSATLSSNNARIIVVTSSTSYADLAPGDSALGATPFRVQISPVMQHEETSFLMLTVTASTLQTESIIALECQSGEPVYSAHLFTGAVNPGTTNNLRVTLRNAGTLTLNDATAQIISLSPFVQVDDAAGTYGDILSGQEVNNGADQFTVTSNTLTFRGHQAPMRVIVSTSDGYIDTTQFVVSIGAAIGTDPTGPDAYGYFAYDNTDVSYEMHPTFAYVNISQGGMGTDLNINDNGVKDAIGELWSVVRPLPFTFTYYGQSFDTVTICSNGWMAFGNHGWNDLFRNYPLPAINSAENMLAPYWDDLKTDGALGVWDYYDATEHRYIVQWKAQGAWTSTNLDFEVILKDEEFDPTFDGNGQLLFQYNDIVMGMDGSFEEPAGCTIGIQNAEATIGLQYAFLTTYSPGSANVVDGRAILFTTNARMLFGAIQGNVTDAETSLPMPGVDVTIDGYNYHALTDVSGHYFLDDVLIGTYTVRVHKRSFNDATVADVLVELDSTETINFAMLHPEFALSLDTIFVALPEEPVETSYEIQNGGNGPLDYSTTITYAGDESPDPWDYLDGINISAATEDYLVLGCEFAQDRWWISGGSGPSLYKFTVEGDYDGSILQPATGIGWFDMAWDGTYLYGSEQRSSGGGQIIGIDLNGQVHATIPSPLNPSRAIAYDPATDHFWIADFTSDVYEIDRQGTIHDQISNIGNVDLEITGLAWHEVAEDGFKLLLFCQQNGSGTQLWKMHPASHDFQLITNLESNPGEHAGGLTITPGYNSTLLVLGGILQGNTGDRLGIYEVTFNTTWIDVTPMQATVTGGQSQEVTVVFDPTFLRTDEYRVNLNMRSEVLDTTYVLPVVLSVASDVPDADNRTLPISYALFQNYPNPFNPSTEIRFDLPEGGYVKLQVYNTLGQRIRTFTDGMRVAGSHRVSWDGRNEQGASVAAGVYIYRLESPNFVSAKKMVLLR